MNRSIHRLLRRYALTGSFRRQKTSSREYVSRPVFVERLQAEPGAFFSPQARPQGTLTGPELAKALHDWKKPHQGLGWDKPWWAFWR